nr:T9SS type A sorting domain-containing protein [Bacteroidales bacterium]
GIVENNSPNFQLYIHPNPNNGNFFVTLNASKSAEIVLCITDNKGNEIYRNTLSSSKIQHYPINLGNPSSGVYLLKVESKTGKSTAKIIVK